ncbi:MAG: aminotransferase class V-fold PLP-dependent enzyme [Polyangiaceae bacterium]|nr:aminotransferase class V-fold PLP-dependent enzyme [Polyangiaceae bacterium]
MLDPAALRPHYSAFLGAGDGSRVLLTGHSHQAWPDVAREGVLEAFDDAARLVDDKWGPAFERAATIRGYVAKQLVGAAAEEVALGQNTHELVTRFLSALDLRARPRLVTTSGEFHSMHRQLSRLSEAGVEVVRVATSPLESVSERLIAALDERTAAVLVSSVLFETSSRVSSLAELGTAAKRLGVEVLVDAYHGFGVMPLSLSELGGEHVFVTAGGYKYAQWGEGCCFLRVPKACELRPVFTGWFSDFANLDKGRDAARIGYGETPADRFAGSTYDPVSHYRAARVIRFFAEQGLEVDKLRELSLHQTGHLIAGLRASGFGDRILTPREDAARGGFVALRTPQASAVTRALRELGVYVDSRGDVLRFGPAPYLLESELERGVEAYTRVTHELA